jgi:hypothetical protein
MLNMNRTGLLFSFTNEYSFIVFLLKASAMAWEGMADSKCVIGILAGLQAWLRSAGLPPLSVPKRLCRKRSRPDQLPQGDPECPDAAGHPHPGLDLLLVAVLGILSECESLRYLERFAQRQPAVLPESLGIRLKCPPSDSSFRYFFLEMDGAAICSTIRYWTIAEIPCGASGLDQLIYNGKTQRG